MIEIDGAMGEGGGQVLRTSLSLSLVTGEGFRMTDIRANRGNAGLARQHLTAVRAAAKICGAEVEGAEQGSQTLTFEPREVRAGDYDFDIGTAGSTTLVLQTVLPALAGLEETSTVTVTGGTHNLHAPPFEYLDGTYRPILERLGADLELRLVRHGFYPKGGGRLEARVTDPLDREAHLALTDRGDLRALRATSILANLPDHIAERELETLQTLLDRPVDQTRTVRVSETDSPGNALLVAVETEALTETFSVIGRKGLPAEKVAQRAAEQVDDYLASGAPVGPHLADQLLLPMALTGGGVYRTSRVTSHTETQMALIPEFLPAAFDVSQGERAATIRVDV
jgi:RNA 3'-terminal phosphate cyclase (ATP)